MAKDTEFLVKSGRGEALWSHSCEEKLKGRRASFLERNILKGRWLVVADFPVFLSFGIVILGNVAFELTQYGFQWF